MGNQAFITLEDDQFSVYISNGIGETVAKIRTRDELDKLVARFNLTGFLCSSSLDFPSEYTDDPELIEIADTIRGRK